MGYIYTKDISISDGKNTSIQPNDIVVLNDKNIWTRIDDEVSGLNPIPSFTIAKGISAVVSAVNDDYVSKSKDNIISSQNTFTKLQTFEQMAANSISAVDMQVVNLSAANAKFGAISVKDADKSYSFDSYTGLSVLTAFEYLSGKIDIETKRLMSSDVDLLSGFVDGKIGDAKAYVNENYLPLSGGTLIGSLSVDKDAKLCVLNSDSFIVGNQTLCTILSNEISLSTQTAVNKLSTDLHNDFKFGYDLATNQISATVAGKTLAFSADRFTEARMLQNVYVGYPFSPTGHPVLFLEFKTEDPTAITVTSVDLTDVMPLYNGKDGVDVNYGDGKFWISADSTICRRDDISSINAANAVPVGQILSSLQQEHGVISYGTAPILSSYVEGLSDYVENAISSYNLPLSTIYGEWHIYPPIDKSGKTLSVKDTVDIDGKTWYTLVADSTDVAGPFTSIDPCYIVWSENASIYKTTTMRKADHYILGANLDKPIQPKIDFNSLSVLDEDLLTSLNKDSNLSTVIDAVVAIRDMLKQFRSDIEHLSSAV